MIHLTVYIIFIFLFIFCLLGMQRRYVFMKVIVLALYISFSYMGFIGIILLIFMYNYFGSKCFMAAVIMKDSSR